ncbi:MAG: EAL domain-containing protein [Candidatus Limnocylindria bacterium]
MTEQRPGGGSLAERPVRPAQSSRRKRTRALRDELRLAVAQGGGIKAHYQPIVDMHDGRVVRLEALARWTHKDLGPIAPTEFIPVAERGGLIRDLGWRVLEHAMRDMAPWRERSPGLRCAMNLSADVLAQPHLAGEIDRTLQKLGASPDHLSVEITESVLVAHADRTRDNLEELRKLGVRVEIDDFGTGFSSLRYLQLLPVDSVKIDRQFVAGIFHERKSETIVRAVVGLCHELGFEVVAEGVEDEATWEVLRALGCDSAQGYLISEPMPAAQILPWLVGWEDRAPRLAPTRDGGAEASARRSVLVVDDEPAILALVSELLTMEGYSVQTAANGEEALRAVQLDLPALILLDVHMPVLDGEGFVRALRSRGIRLPVVIMTAGPSAEHWARTLGADASVAKPFGLDDLLHVAGRFTTPGPRPH